MENLTKEELEIWAEWLKEYSKRGSVGSKCKFYTNEWTRFNRPTKSMIDRVKPELRRWKLDNLNNM